jgi:hypothetical protein
MNHLKAQYEHPRLYQLHQHAPIRVLGHLVDFAWSLPKQFKTHRKGRAARSPRVQRAYSPKIVHVHVYGGQINL